MNRVAELDHQFVWHPFTQMRDWLRSEPIVIVSGRGSVLEDVHGREYLDANSSIWTNLHGHAHPEINAAVSTQLGKIAHSSHLGLASEPASILAGELVRLAAFAVEEPSPGPLAKVFYSDDGSTAMEVALKLAFQYHQRLRGRRPASFISIDQAYHGDTIGAASLGHIDLFHRSYEPLLFPSEKVMSPYCYRCPFNRAKPERADARDYRECGFECVGRVEEKFGQLKREERPCAALVVEPLMQGAAGMIPQPPGWLRRVAEIARGFGALLIADEVMTAFGRTGATFACERERVRPDLLAAAKGLTGGYLPMAATLVTGEIFEAFLGDYEEFKTFFHGHSFTGNQLGAAAALASLKLLCDPAGQAHRKDLEGVMAQSLAALWELPAVGDVRQAGLVAGIELVRDWRTRTPFALEEKMGIKVCEAMARRGVLTRPVGNVIVLMPPYSTTLDQLRRMVQALYEAVQEVSPAALDRAILPR
jgi:adenosylmethionine-8-amino-7-oxononanoate aminotransferase